ncbi:MAG: HAD family hydrolase [Acidiphilium sp.]|nr:HAD family hydrolase [Acidiphilium sp.]MDD4935565.1 HAD family hydrolase [Acidiphilium sp.]
MPKLRALIFDVDGTLAETEELHRISFNATFAEVGLDWDWDRALYRELLAVTGGKERIRYYIDEFDGSVDIPPEGIRVLHERKTAIYAARMAEGALGPRPGILRLIHEARQAGVLCAIATTTSRPNIDALLQSAFAPDAVSWFAAIAAGDEVARKKPAPDVYVLALERLGLAADECLAIEDSRNGLESARAAGLGCVITVSPYTEDQDFTAALKIVAHMGDFETRNPTIEGGMVTLPMLQSWHSAGISRSA